MDKMKTKKVKVLGVEYKILFISENKDEILKEARGYCNTSIKKICIDDFSEYEKIYARKLSEGIELRIKQTVRHEIIHAFMHESGLYENNSWVQNEDCVEWIASMMPKMVEAMKKSGCL